MVLAVSAALICAYIVIWTQVSATDIGRSDFTSFYVGGILLRHGHGPQLYNEALQQTLHSALIAPDREANLPFVNSPVAAALMTPATFLPLEVAYRLWGALELAVLVIAVVVALRASPWPAGTSRDWKVAIAAAALASMGSWTVLLQAQWTPLVALGLALAYRDWTAGRNGRGAFLLVVTAGAVKPHLALALIAFMLGWRDGKLLTGALLGGAALVIASLALVGPSGVAGFLGIVAGSTTRWELRNMLSVVGLVGSFFGDGLTAHLLAALASLGACAVALWLGDKVRRDHHRLATALAGAALLSLFAAPHAYSHDLVMLAPVVVWSAAEALVRASDCTAGQHSRLTNLPLLIWALLTAVAFADFMDGAATPPGQLTGWALLIAASVACTAVATNRAFARRAAAWLSVSTSAN